MDRYGPKHVQLTPQYNKQSVQLHCVSRWTVYKKKNVLEFVGQQITIWRMLIACWISKATNTNSEYVMLIALYTAAVVTRTNFSVTVYVHCHFYLLVELKKKKN